MHNSKSFRKYVGKQLHTMIKTNVGKKEKKCGQLEICFEIVERKMKLVSFFKEKYMNTFWLIDLRRLNICTILVRDVDERPCGKYFFVLKLSMFIYGLKLIHECVQLKLKVVTQMFIFALELSSFSCKNYLLKRRT